eukprot:1133153-Prymnesium_polylepis.1
MARSRPWHTSSNMARIPKHGMRFQIRRALPNSARVPKYGRSELGEVAVVLFGWEAHVFEAVSGAGTPLHHSPLHHASLITHHSPLIAHRSSLITHHSSLIT